METNYKITKSGYMSSMEKTHNQCDGSTIFNDFETAKDALIAHAETSLKGTYKKEMVRSVKAIKEQHLEWDETHLEI